MNADIYRTHVAIARAEVMQPLGLDLLLAYSDDAFQSGAVQFLTGFDSYAMYALAVVPSRGDVSLAFGLHHSAYLVRVKDTAVADYFLGTYEPGSLCAEVLKEVQAGLRPRVGVVRRATMLRRIDRDLNVGLKDAEIVDIDAAFWQAAWNATPGGPVRQAFRRSGSIARASVQAIADSHFSEQTIARTWADIGLRARRLGADVLNREMVQIKLGAGLPLPERLSRPQTLQTAPGHAMAAEIMLSFQGCRSVCGSTVVDASAPAALVRGVDEARRSHEAIASSVRPGESLQSLAEKASGRPDMMVRFDVLNGDRQWAPETLCPGMAIAVRSLHKSEFGTIHFADTMMMTASGAECLTGRVGG